MSLDAQLSVRDIATLPLGGELVGVVAFNNIEKMNRCATMGYCLAKSKMGNGSMTEAVKALI